jgi:hypothetical protein
MDSLFSFPVGLFHPLQHAGLSRRTPACRHPIAIGGLRCNAAVPQSLAGRFYETVDSTFISTSDTTRGIS